MRLLQLKMCAFGPYASVQEVDFTQINDKKLFLITGPTGAGKTSIFDAISYALYGFSSGNDRDSDTMRSHYASLDEETYVSLTFELKGNIYYIERRPKQQRKKAKGEGFTIKPADAILKFSDQVYTGIGEVNQKVLDILGINYHQFRQIVMLPQGEFRKLLEANSLEREDIFRKIFKTEPYKMLQEHLKTNAKQLENEIGESYRFINNYVDKINTANDVDLENLISVDYRNYDQILESTKQLTKLKEEELSKLLNIIGLKEIEVLDDEHKINDALVINKKFEQRDQLIERYKVLEGQFKSIEALELRVQKANNAKLLSQSEEQIEKLKLTISDLIKKKNENESEYEQQELASKELDKDLLIKKVALDLLPTLQEELYELKNKQLKFKEYQDKLIEFNDLETSIKQNNLYFGIENQSLETLKEEIIQIKTNIINNAELYQLKTTYISNVHDLEIKIKNYDELIKLIDDIIILQNEHQRLVKIYEACKFKSDEAKHTYEHQNEVYKRNLAGILALNLMEHAPCPVCGSEQHPNKAMCINEVVSEEELNNLKELYEQSEKITSDAYIEVLKTFELISDKKKSVGDNEDLNNRYQESIQNKENTQKALIKMNEMIKDINQKLEENRVWEEKKEQLEHACRDKETKLLEYKNNLTELMHQQKMIKNWLETVEDEDFESLEVINQKIFDKEMMIEQYKNEYQIVFEDITKCKNTMLILQTKIKEQNSSLENYQNSLILEEIKFKESIYELDFLNEEDYKKYKYNKEEMKTFEYEIRSYYDEKSYVEKTIHNLKLELNNLSIRDVNAILEHQNLIKTEIDNLRSEEKKLHLLIQNNLVVIKDIEYLYKKVKHKIEEFNVLSDVSKAANGDNDQKLTFERYVLAAYFDEIIYAANLRLQDMSNQRYVLIRKDERGKGASQQGLDLEVIDYYTGKSRSVKTLSGGEAFIASLSLALGLADCVQGYSGGIQLDTIFIDEGFGSLDPEALEHAISTLVNIQKTGRLVGIISHVEELKERIQVKLEITSTKTGSYANFVL